MKINFLHIVVCFIAMTIFSCNQSNNVNNQNSSEDDVVATYVAYLQPLNTNVTGMNAAAEAKFIVTKDSVFVTIDATGVPPQMQHWQHFHGFIDNRDATCASQSNDANGDGIIDVTETESVSGTTMVPFNKDPQDMNVGNSTYPEAGDDSSYHYEASIPLAQLRAAFAKSFSDSTLSLDKRVLYIHGVPSNKNLPSTVASISDIPANVTLPIACGKIEKVQ